MKSLYLFSAAAIFLSMVLCPLMSMDDAAKEITKEITKSMTEEGSKQPPDADVFRLLDTAADTVTVIDAADYIYGVVASEMPAEYEVEALKAQAVAAYTYACRKRSERSDLKYDVTNSSSSDQAYATEEKLKERFGENYDRYMEKIKAAVDSVIGETVVYDGEPAFTVYHDISAGKTESALNVWNEDFPYLIPVESAGDLLSPSYTSKKTFSDTELASAFADTDASLSGDADGWIGDIDYSGSGTVLSLTVGGAKFTGSEIRKKLGLKSAAFVVERDGDSFVFSVHGHGHLVGMSQYGAQSMASGGNRYDEILLWYYPGCELKK